MRPVDWIFIVIIAVVIIYYFLSAKKKKLHGRPPGRGDNRIVDFLAEKGYQVLSARPTRKIKMKINKKEHFFEMKSDYLAASGGKRYLVRLRTDDGPVRLYGKAWRQALLRDVLVFKVDGVLVVDIEKDTLHKVHFTG